MKTRAAQPTGFSDLCKTAFESSMALWPLFFIRAVFVVCNFIFFLLAAMACCFPLVQFLFQHLDELDEKNLKNLLQQGDLMSYFTNSSTWLALGVLVLLYIAVTWFFFAFYDSSVYNQVYSYQKKGKTFAWKQFLSDGIRFTAPMMGLQLLCLFTLFSYILAGGMVLALGMVLFHFLPWWVGVPLAFPAGLVFGAGFLVFFAGMGLAGVYLVEGNGIFDSLGKGIQRALADKGRIAVLFFLVLIIYFVFYFAFNVVFSVFGLLPYIGLAFKGILLVINTAIAIGLNIYLDALCVAVRLDARDDD